MKTGIVGLGERPLIMGVLNVTPDSFSDGGKFANVDKAFDHALSLIDSGADIIDVGGESSRPGAESVSVDEELSRVVPIIKKLAKKTNIPISIDTVKSEVAKKAFDSGASILNDISALKTDEKIASLAAKYDAFVVLMHMRGTPADMQANTKYDDLIGEISRFLNDAVRAAVEGGVSKERIVIDPGIGFGKSVEDNFSILKNLDKFKEIGYPVLVGASRKSFIGQSLGLDIDQRLEGSIAAACYAVLNGADIIRVHDVRETKRAISIIEKIAMAEKA